MHISATATIAFLTSVLAHGHVALAAPRCQSAPIAGPFYLTVVPHNGSAVYPATIAVVSRGAEILSSGLSYGQQFTFDSATKRLFEGDNPKMGNGEISAGLPPVFTEETGDWPLEQIAVDCAVYLVKAGTTADSVYSWWSEPSTNGLPKEIDWQTSSVGPANVALRVDTQIPSSHR